MSFPFSAKIQNSIRLNKTSTFDFFLDNLGFGSLHLGHQAVLPIHIDDRWSRQIITQSNIPRCRSRIPRKWGTNIQFYKNFTGVPGARRLDQPIKHKAYQIWINFSTKFT